MAHGSSFTLSIELQQDDGKVAESECLQETAELSRKIFRCQVLKWAKGTRGPWRLKLAPYNVVREASRPQPWQGGGGQPRAGTRVCEHVHVRERAVYAVCACTCLRVSRTPQSAEDGDRAAACVCVSRLSWQEEVPVCGVNPARTCPPAWDLLSPAVTQAGGHAGFPRPLPPGEGAEAGRAVAPTGTGAPPPATNSHSKSPASLRS